MKSMLGSDMGTMSKLELEHYLDKGHYEDGDVITVEIEEIDEDDMETVPAPPHATGDHFYCSNCGTRIMKHDLPFKCGCGCIFDKDI